MGSLKPVVHVFQIGYGKWGKIAFKKFVQLSKELRDVNLILEGICDIDPKARADLEKIMEKEKLKTKIFSYTQDMYNHASGMSNVLIYDASPGELHTSHVLKSIEYKFFHLAEKPPYLTKEDEEMVEKQDGNWGFDAIEYFNPAVLFAKRFLKEERINILSVETFRYNSIGLKKILHGDHRYGVQGGDILDKAIHEIYLLDFFDSINMKLTDSKIDFFMINSIENPKLVDIRLKIFGGKNPATAQSNINGLAGKVPIGIHTGWLGVPDLDIVREIEKNTGKKIKFSKESEINGKKFLDEELRIFVIKGEKDGKPIEMYGDMKHFQFFLKGDEWKEITLEKNDQLYIVLRNAVYTTAGKEKFFIDRERIDLFSMFLFEARDKSLENPINPEKEAEKTREYIMKKLL